MIKVAREVLSESRRGQGRLEQRCSSRHSPGQGPPGGPPWYRRRHRPGHARRERVQGRGARHCSEHDLL